MVNVKCTKCGNIFRGLNPRGAGRQVFGCAKCTKLFPDKAIDDILNEFKRNF